MLIFACPKCQDFLPQQRRKGGASEIDGRRADQRRLTIPISWRAKNNWFVRHIERLSGYVVYMQLHFSHDELLNVNVAALEQESRIVLTAIGPICLSNASGSAAAFATDLDH